MKVENHYYITEEDLEKVKFYGVEELDEVFAIKPYFYDKAFSYNPDDLLSYRPEYYFEIVIYEICFCDEIQNELNNINEFLYLLCVEFEWSDDPFEMELDNFGLYLISNYEYNKIKNCTMDNITTEVKKIIEDTYDIRDAGLFNYAFFNFCMPHYEDESESEKIMKDKSNKVVDVIREYANEEDIKFVDDFIMDSIDDACESYNIDSNKSDKYTC